MLNSFKKYLKFFSLFLIGIFSFHLTETINATLAIAQQGTQSGLSLPRLASFRADEVNVRSGPGLRYPISYIYKRRGMPVRIIAEFDAWRKISDHENSEGWVHRSLLTSKRTGIVIDELATLRQEADDNAIAVARLGRSMIVDVDQCRNKWCKVSVNTHVGWLKEQALWGIRLDTPAISQQ